MNEIIYPLLITSIAGFATLLGNLLLFVPIQFKNRLISFSLGLSFAVMLLISVFDLIPEGLKILYKEVSLVWLFCFAFSCLLIGYILVFFLDRKIGEQDNLYKIGILSMLSLLIHNIPEGILCAITSSTNLHLGLKFSFMIMIHNIPEGICISLPIYYSTGSRMKAVFYTFISSLGEISGALLTLFLLKNYLNQYVLFFILLVTAGIMITLSITKVLKEGVHFQEYKYLMIGILLGILIVLFTL